jgi:predicted RND superfamily exporter protein
MTLAERLVRAWWRVRWPLVALLLCALAGAAWQVRGVGVDNAVTVWFVDGDPALRAYADFQDTFGNDEVVVLALHDPDGILDADGLARVRAVTDAAAATEGIVEVRSITNVAHARLDDAPVGPDEAAAIVVAPVVGETDDAGIRERVLADPLLAGRLVSRDGSTAVVLARMDDIAGVDARRDVILDDLSARVRAAAGEEVPMAGIGVVYSALNRASSRDVAVIGAASYGLIFVLLAILLGRPWPVALTLAVIGAAALLTMGLYGAAGRDLNMVTMALPTLIFVMCIEDAVHVLQEVAHRQETDRVERIVAAVSAVFWPCLFTTLTTAAGFVALGAARMQVVRDLGWFATFGILAAFVVTLIVLVPALAWPRTEPRAFAAAALERWMVGVGRFASRRRFEVLALSAAVFLLGAWGTSRIVADTYSIDYFYDSHPVRTDSAFIEEHFGPYVPLELVVRSPSGLRTSEALGAVAAWQDRMETDGEVGWTSSVADVTRRLNQLLSADGTFAVPADDAALEQALFVYESDPDAEIDRLVADGWREVRVTVGLKMMSASRIGAAIDRLTGPEARGAGWPEGVEVVPSGYLPLYVTMMDYVVRSQVDSFATAFVLVFGLLALLFRSARMTLLAVPGNLFPLFVTLGLMGLLEIRLDVATVTIAAIVLGLVVDSTIHFLFRFRESLRRTGDHEAAIEETMRTSGVAMTTTSLALVLGFAVLGLAQTKSVAFFGLLTAAAMGSAWFGDALLLPALLVTLRPKL